MKKQYIITIMYNNGAVKSRIINNEYTARWLVTRLRKDISVYNVWFKKRQN